jgi:hypothetical protein
MAEYCRNVGASGGADLCIVLFINLLNIYGTAEHHGQYGVLIHDSYPDVRPFYSLLHSDFPSQWPQLLQWPLVSLLGVPDQVKESLLLIHLL